MLSVYDNNSNCRSVLLQVRCRLAHLTPATIPRLQIFFHPTSYPVFLPPLFQVLPEAESVFVVEPGAVFAAAELSPEAVVSAVEPGAVFAAAELSPEAAVSAVEPGVVFAAAELSPEAAAFAAEPGAVFVSEPQASVYIAVASVVLIPVSAFVVEADSPGRPRFPAFPNVYHFSSSSSSVEAVGEESVHSSIGARTNYALCNILSNPGLHHNKNWGHYYNNPMPGHNNVNDTSALPIDATTSHSRKRGLHQCRDQRKHRPNQVSLSHPVAPKIRWAAADQY